MQNEEEPTRRYCGPTATTFKGGSPARRSDGFRLESHQVHAIVASFLSLSGDVLRVDVGWGSGS